MNEKIKLTLKGFLIGITETMPGVSGGTMALILGIYKQLISAISNFDLKALKYLVKLEKNKFLQKINFRNGDWSLLIFICYLISFRKLSTHFKGLLFWVNARFFSVRRY